MIVPQKKSYYLLMLLILKIKYIYSAQQRKDLGLPGNRWPCTNEGEEVAPKTNIANIKCFKCICQNGFVECEKDSCPATDDCYAIQKNSESCCDKCKECVYKGEIYQSGAEWFDEDDPCSVFKCVAGVITESITKCYTACSNPLKPAPGKCCPSCLGCLLNGQLVHEDHRAVTLSEDPCVKCHCNGRRLTCVKQACPILQCPISLQYAPEGSCCKKCIRKIGYNKPAKGGCLMNGEYFPSAKDTKVRPDACSICTCHNETSLCLKQTCPVLDCLPQNQVIRPGECCPKCINNGLTAEYLTSECTYKEKTYKNNESWKLGPCQSCECRNGEIRCAQTQCPKLKCRPNEHLSTIEGQCCAQCQEKSHVCTVFGDPHYKTFDGKFYSFQGACKYQLTADCVTHSFSIRVTNGVRQQKKQKSWTKTITFKMAEIKINLGQKLRVKVNGTRVDLPYTLDKLVRINKTHNDEVVVESYLGIKIIYDGYNFLQVEAPVSYKGKLCGLCGNYNNVGRDDLTSRNGITFPEHDVKKFANSWRVGGMKACARRPNEHELSQNPQQCINNKKKVYAKCFELKSQNIFENCNSRVNPDKYFEFCKMDMCDCATHTCYCESFAAYAHECERNGVKLLDWRDLAGCKLSNLHNQNNQQQIGQNAKRRKNRKGKARYQKVVKNINIS